MEMRVYVICAVNGSCLINAVYENKESAEKWIEKENNKLGLKAYYIEQSQLIKGELKCER